jgi:hypothetical protein
MPQLQPLFSAGTVLVGADDGGIDDDVLKVGIVGHGRE